MIHRLWFIDSEIVHICEFQKAQWVVVHDDDAVIRWKLLVDKLAGNTVQYNFNCLYSPPVNEFPMRKGRNNVSRKCLTWFDLSWPLFQPRCIRSLIGFRNFAMDHALQWPVTHRKSFLNSPWLINGITCPLKMFFSMELWENWRIWRILNFSLESVAI